METEKKQLIIETTDKFLELQSVIYNKIHEIKSVIDDYHKLIDDINKQQLFTTLDAYHLHLEDKEFAKKQEKFVNNHKLIKTLKNIL